jgi:hypothetical protein
MGYGYVLTARVVADQKLFLATGEFGLWARDIEQKLQINAIREAPRNVRTGKSQGAPPVGNLKANISAELQKVTLRTFHISLISAADYSMFVHEGTSTIVARNSSGHFRSASEGMRLPANPQFGGAHWRQRVRGQKANPFLRRAWNDTALSHSSMGRFGILR